MSANPVDLLRALVERDGLEATASKLDVSSRSVRRWLAGEVPLDGVAAVAVGFLAAPPKAPTLAPKPEAPAKPVGLIGRTAARIVEAVTGTPEALTVRLVVEGRVVQHFEPMRAARLAEGIGRGVEPAGGWSKSEMVALYQAMKERRALNRQRLADAGALVGPDVDGDLGREWQSLTRGRRWQRASRIFLR